MLTSAASGAGDGWPVGCAVLVAVLLSLLLWAMLLVLLWQLFSTEGRLTSRKLARASRDPQQSTTGAATDRGACVDRPDAGGGRFSLGVLRVH